jgi:hypothetical protein
MLWNPKHDLPAETKADPFSLDALIAWLETKEPTEEYRYGACFGCAIAQYLMSLGVEKPLVGARTWTDFAEKHLSDTPLPVHWNKIAVREPHTFGAALERARALKASGTASE